jgi:hypothetical protein
MISRSRTPIEPLACEYFLHIDQGHALARRAGPGTAQVTRRDAEVTEGNRDLVRRGELAEAWGGGRGTRLLRGGSLPRSTGGSPPGAALPPVGCPRSPQAASPLGNAPTVTAPARTGRAVLLAPSAPIAG